MTLTLRPYQLEAIQSCRDRIASGRRAPLVVSPTGSGKTIIQCEIVRLHLAAKPINKVLIVAHRRELIGQISGTLLRMGLHDISEVFPGSTYRRHAKVNVASTQTLQARSLYPEATMVVFDEAHHYSSDDWNELTKQYASCIRLGFTATPMRSDGRGMSPAFDSLVVVSTIRQLTASGFLVPCRVIAPDKPLRRPNLACQPVEAYKEHALGRRAVVFAEFVKDAETFKNQFIEAGYNAVVIHGEMSDADRRNALRAHQNGAVLVNCMVLTEGWDSPDTSCCILARGCGSVGTYLQIVGRVLRTAPGKSEALLIDLSGRAFHSHGAPDEDREYSLVGKGIRRREEGEVRFCPTCGQPAIEWPCDNCGYDPTGSKVQDPRYTGDELTERYSSKRKEDDGKRTETLARWIAEARARGWKPWSAVAKFTSVYAMVPSSEMVHLATEMSRNKKCSACIKCGKQTSNRYKGGMCGTCAFKGARQ